MSWGKLFLGFLSFYIYKMGGILFWKLFFLFTRCWLKVLVLELGGRRRFFASLFCFLGVEIWKKGV